MPIIKIADTSFTSIKPVKRFCMKSCRHQFYADKRSIGFKTYFDLHDYKTIVPQL